jgi:signal peptidase II
VLAVLVAVITVVLDQVTKNAVVARLVIGGCSPVLGNFLRLKHIRNSGAVFGMMRGAGGYFTLFSIIAAGVLVVVLFFSRKAPVVVKFSLGLVLGGAVGNLVDRLRFGEVVDFIDIGVGASARWPCFNIADLAITVGVILLVLHSLGKSGHHAAE